MTTVNFGNNELIEITLKEVEDDYDVCILDCSPGRFMLHNNIFHAADLILVPNLPAPLSVYCNNMLMDDMQQDTRLAKKVLSFYNMVQIHKILHKQYLDNAKDASWMLNGFIPFYTDIELIGITRESLFHQEKECRANTYYLQLWLEICERMQWQSLNNPKGKIVDIDEEQQVAVPVAADFVLAAHQTPRANTSV
jgi:chromosome partitioning protein